MRTLLFAIVLVGGAACDERHSSNFYDLGAAGFKRIGDPCGPDTPPTSQCGYSPQFYCAPSGICASACRSDSDCTDGAVCSGAGDMIAGECRLVHAASDGG